MTPEARAEIMRLPAEAPKTKPKRQRRHIEELQMDAGNLLRGCVSLAEAYPEIAKQWHPTKNGNIMATDIPKSAHIIAWWQCEKGHEWEAPVDKRTSSKTPGRCPVCSNRKLLIGYNDLATTHPEITKQWHSTKNGTLNPTDVFAGSSQKVWWECEEGHEWESRISNRTNGTGCPHCVIHNFLECAPEIAKQWHPNKNHPHTPQEYALYSSQKVWWQCHLCGYEWKASIKSRAEGHGCPVCSNSIVRAKFNDLATTHPELAQEWHPTKNTLKPTDVSAGSDKIVWWQCKFGHEWEAKINNRKSGTGCPHCSQQTSFNEQACFYYAQQMCPDALNRAKVKGKEADVFIPSLKAVGEYDGWWHDDSRIDADLRKAKHMQQHGMHFMRIREPTCPILSEDVGDVFTLSSTKRHDVEDAIRWFLQHLQRLNPELTIPDINLERDEPIIHARLTNHKQERSLAHLHPQLCSSWDWEKNAPLTPDMVTPFSNRKVFWICPNGHSYSTSPSHRMQNHNCPYCSNHRVLIGFNDLATTHPHILDAWCFDLNELLPTQVTAGSRYKAAWKCPNGHIIHTPVYKYLESPHCGRCGTQGGVCGVQYADGTYLRFQSVTEAAATTNYSRRSIRRYCNGERLPPNNEQWSWVT